MVDIVTTFLAVFAALFPIVDPIAGGIIFFGLTSGATPRTRRKMAARVAVYAFVVLNVALYVGAYVLNFFGISLPVLRVAGGLVVAMAGWTMLHAKTADSASQGVNAPEMTHEEYMRQAFYPITLPLTTGPGTISVLIALGTGRPQHAGWLQNLHFAIGAVTATAAIAVTIYLFYAGAGIIRRAFGSSGTEVAIRLTAFILLCIGVQILWYGVEELIQSIIPATSPV